MVRALLAPVGGNLAYRDMPINPLGGWRNPRIDPQSYLNCKIAVLQVLGVSILVTS